MTSSATLASPPWGYHPHSPWPPSPNKPRVVSVRVKLASNNSYQMRKCVRPHHGMAEWLRECVEGNMDWLFQLARRDNNNNNNKSCLFVFGAGVYILLLLGDQVELPQSLDAVHRMGVALAYGSALEETEDPSKEYDEQELESMGVIDPQDAFWEHADYDSQQRRHEGDCLYHVISTSQQSWVDRAEDAKDNNVRVFRMKVVPKNPSVAWGARFCGVFGQEEDKQSAKKQTKKVVTTKKVALETAEKAQQGPPPKKKRGRPVGSKTKPKDPEPPAKTEKKEDEEKETPTPKTKSGKSPGSKPTEETKEPEKKKPKTKKRKKSVDGNEDNHNHKEIKAPPKKKSKKNQSEEELTKSSKPRRKESIDTDSTPRKSPRKPTPPDYYTENGFQEGAVSGGKNKKDAKKAKKKKSKEEKKLKKKKSNEDSDFDDQYQREKPKKSKKKAKENESDNEEANDNNESKPKSSTKKKKVKEDEDKEEGGNDDDKKETSTPKPKRTRRTKSYTQWQETKQLSFLPREVAVLKAAWEEAPLKSHSKLNCSTFTEKDLTAAQKTYEWMAGFDEE